MGTALDRLEQLREEGRFLFQGDRRVEPISTLYPSAPLTSFDPESLRGYWAPGTGLLPPSPLVRDVFASPVAAALLAVVQNSAGGRAFHTDEFRDGTVALTLGEQLDSAGDYRRLLRRLEALDDSEPIPDLSVNVLPRGAFPEDRLGFPLPGVFVCPEPVPILERIELTVADVRELSRRIGPRLPPLDRKSAGALAPPFTGPFSAGGHLQFHPDSGATREPHRRPSERDLRSALNRHKARSNGWLNQRFGRPADSPDTLPGSMARSLASRLQPGEATQELLAHWTTLLTLPATDRPEGALGRALAFIEQNCTRQITAGEIAAAARVSLSHLYALFQAKMATTPLSYAGQRRLQVAEELLLRTHLSVAEIAERCGFKEQTSLTRNFKRYRGKTPAKLRRDARIHAEIS